MASKLKLQGLKAMHTAGIFSDMTVDGPEIGTLVVVVDRAKNLPNRKTIGKQNPYCAARLGKEAKKTDTDHRGGQTPKWDQELRYTVHDSPDYYQLKVSIFNDDKKTDLIGETRIDLRDIIIPGGGQNDVWHNLNYKGKYAGEIRVEITYYDTRIKQEKVETSRMGTPKMIESDCMLDDGQIVSRQPKQSVKRRPLPSDPVTGEISPIVDTGPNFNYFSPSRIKDETSMVSSTYITSPATGPEYSSTGQKVLKPQNPQLISSNNSHSSTRSRQRLSNVTPDYRKVLSHNFQVPTSMENSGDAQIAREYQNYRYSSHQPSFSMREYNVSSNNLSNFNGTTRSNVRGEFPDAGIVVTNPVPHPPPHSQHEINSNDNLRHQDQYISRHISCDIDRSGDEIEALPNLGDNPPPPPIHRSGNTNNHIDLCHSVIPNQSSLSQGRATYRNQPEEHNSGHKSKLAHEDLRPSPRNSQSRSYQGYNFEQIHENNQNLRGESYHQWKPRHHLYSHEDVNDVEFMHMNINDTSPHQYRGEYNPGLPGDKHQYEDERYIRNVPRRPEPKFDSSGRRGSSVNPNSEYSEVLSGSKSAAFASQSTYSRRLTDPSGYVRLEPNAMARREKMTETYTKYHGSNSDIRGSPQVPVALVPGLAPIIAKEVGGIHYHQNLSRNVH
ncbi:putative c2 domain containing protein [Golovinomyces cichoracearum]|uniref:Putative c2 domain containing protein n=1 Tax=Golovinomyces cichoracearum TaxID=62708 RepID=A0A420J2U8_9PEZI|nr:putative c2 domain containing protein [Golovinomyces cichoracearum]